MGWAVDEIGWTLGSCSGLPLWKMPAAGMFSLWNLPLHWKSWRDCHKNCVSQRVIWAGFFSFFCPYYGLPWNWVDNPHACCSALYHKDISLTRTQDSCWTIQYVGLSLSSYGTAEIRSLVVMVMEVLSTWLQKYIAEDAHLLGSKHSYSEQSCIK